MILSSVNQFEYNFRILWGKSRQGEPGRDHAGPHQGKYNRSRLLLSAAFIVTPFNIHFDSRIHQGEPGRQQSWTSRTRKVQSIGLPQLLIWPNLSRFITIPGSFEEDGCKDSQDWDQAGRQEQGKYKIFNEPLVAHHFSRYTQNYR